MTQDLTRRFNFKHEGSNTSLGDVLIVGEDNVTHPPTPQALRVRPGPESMGTAAHTKQADAAREAIQARKIYELYEQGMGLAVHPGDEGETAQMARRNLGQARDQTDELEAVAVHRTIVRLLEYLTLTPGGRLATESNRIPDPETTPPVPWRVPTGRGAGGEPALLGTLHLPCGVVRRRHGVRRHMRRASVPDLAHPHPGPSIQRDPEPGGPSGPGRRRTGGEDPGRGRNEPHPHGFLTDHPPGGPRKPRKTSGTSSDPGREPARDLPHGQITPGPRGGPSRLRKRSGRQ